MAVVIKHVLLDGTVRESMKGYEVPKGHPVYACLAELADKHQDKIEETFKKAQ